MPSLHHRFAHAANDKLRDIAGLELVDEAQAGVVDDDEASNAGVRLLPPAEIFRLNDDTSTVVTDWTDEFQIYADLKKIDNNKKSGITVSLSL